MASSSGRHWRPVSISWTVSINHARRSRSPRVCSSGGEGAQALGIVAMQQGGADGAAEALFLRVGRIAEPAQLPAQGGEGDAADGVEVRRVHGQRVEPIGQTAGGCDHPLSGQGAQLLQQLGATAAEQGAVAQVEAEAAVLLAEGDDPGRASDDGAMAMAPFVTQEALKAFTDRLVEAFAPEQVILFGSMARGTAGVESDADVLVVMPFEGRALEKILEIRNVCQPEFPLDMLLWRPEDIPRRYRWGDPFIREALDHGVVLYG
jgi:uncharacterized protein